MDDLKFKPVIHDHKNFLEKASKRVGFDEAYKALEKYGKLEYEIDTKLYYGSLFNVTFSFGENIDSNFILFFSPLIENCIKKYGVNNVWINNIIVNNLQDLKIVMKDAEISALLAKSNNAAIDAYAANLKAKAAGDAHSEAIYEYSQIIKNYNDNHPR